jgi:hypothetical protein
LGMTGNQDKAARAAARLEQIYERLDPMLDKGMDALDANPLKPGDALGVQRYVRGVELVARAARTVATLIAPPGRGPRAEPAEDDMNDDDRDDSPEALDRLRAELESRLDGLRTTIEAKRLEGWTVVRTAASGGEKHAEAA